MDDYDGRLQQIAERTLTAKLSLWSALLTAHTVLLSVAVEADRASGKTPKHKVLPADYLRSGCPIIPQFWMR